MGDRGRGACQPYRDPAADATAQDVLVAHSLSELDRKLAAESGPGDDVPT
jgi:hypothetical protein